MISAKDFNSRGSQKNGETHNHLTTAANQAWRPLTIGLVLTLAFVLIEFGSGLYANSLALVTDAAHNLADALALGLSWWALTQSLRPANAARTYGYHRAGILVALLNAASLIAISLFIGYEALGRLSRPPEVRENLIILIGLVGFAVNAGIAWGLHSASRHDVNVRSAFVHMAGDALSTLGVVAAGVGIALVGWHWLDPLASLLIALLIMWSAWDIVRETTDILLEGAPRGMDIDEMVRDINEVPGVLGVHDLHVWSIASNLRMLSAHILTENMKIADGAEVQSAINELLLSKYGIGHTALQLEASGCDPDLLYCELVPVSETDD